jgi:D-3-phosphoglycerate dehydrogenase
MTMSEGLVVLTDSDLTSGHVEERILSDHGFELRRASCRTADDVVIAAGEADALIVQWAPVTAEVLDALPRCRFVSRIGIGVDMIDLDAATQRGVAVANTPDYCVEEVTAHAIALLLACVRRLPQLDRSVRDGAWHGPRTAPDSRRPSHTTVAILGFGRIGSRAAHAAAGIGFRVVVHDPFVPAQDIAARGYEPVPFDEALDRADVVSLHVPLTSTTRKLIDGAAIERLRPGAFIVNTCRGGLIDEPALVAGLESGRIAGAGLDVFEQEPLPRDSPLLSNANVVLSPHSAWYSPPALEELASSAALNVVRFLEGAEVGSILNPGYDRAAIARTELSAGQGRPTSHQSISRPPLTS